MTAYFRSLHGPRDGGVHADIPMAGPFLLMVMSPPHTAKLWLSQTTLFYGEMVIAPPPTPTREIPTKCTYLGKKQQFISGP